MCISALIEKLLSCLSIVGFRKLADLKLAGSTKSWTHQERCTLDNSCLGFHYLLSSAPRGCTSRGRPHEDIGASGPYGGRASCWSGHIYHHAPCRAPRQWRHGCRFQLHWKRLQHKRVMSKLRVRSLKIKIYLIGEKVMCDTTRMAELMCLC